VRPTENPRRPVEPERRFVQRLAGAEADEDPARIHGLERREALRDERRVIALEGDRDRRPDRHALRSLGGRAEPDPGLAGMARLPPGLKVVGAGNPVEAGPLACDGLLEQLPRVVLLVHATEVIPCHFPAATPLA